MPTGVYARKSLADRFWEKVDVRGPDECWPWTASLDGHGYGQISKTDDAGKSMHRAHRVAYEQVNGPIPEGEGAHGTCILHSCDNPPCCNPTHLFPGTATDNAADMHAKGRNNQAKGEASGRAKLTEAQVTCIRSASGTNRQIADLFGISDRHAGGIRRGESWAHILQQEPV